MSGHVTDQALRTLEATVERSGPIDRPRVGVPAADAVPTGEVVRLVLDGSTYRTRPVSTGSGVALPGAYDTPAAARSPDDDPNRLTEWVEDRELEYGRTVHLDVVGEGFKYGLRAPGERATYTDQTGPADSLADIADRLER